MNPQAFEQLVQQQWQAVPDEFMDKVENLSLQIEDQANDALLEELDCAHSDELLGLYQGWPLPERGQDYGHCLPDVIYLYQRPIENHARDRQLELSRVVRETIIHELGHYFGFSEEQIDYFENLWSQSVDKKDEL